MFASIVAKTIIVVTLKFALVAPAATVTLDGTLATALPLMSETTAPPAGAGALNVTVPCDVPPPVTVAGLSVRDDTETMGGGSSDWCVSIA